MLELTPLSELPHNCLLLTLDTVNILLDAATADGRPPPNLPSQLDFILLSHSTPTHINALPRILLTHPYTQTYSTVPITTLGRLSALELTPPGPTVSTVKTEDDAFEFLTPKDVDRAFDKITTLRYSQPTILSHGITITAYPAGHSIGGTIWNIKKDQESIVVMLDWNHAKERTVGGLDAKTLRLLERASCVITDVRGCATPQIPTRRIREQFLIDSITSALTAQQSVMIPALPPTRSLDLLILLDNAFASTPALQPFPAFYLAKTSQKAVRATRTMLEWLSQDITLQDHPLDFKHIKLVTEYQDLAQGPRGPRLVIVDDLEMSLQSFSKQTFLDFNIAGNLILFTSRSTTENSLPSLLLSQWETTSPSLSADTLRPIVGVNLTTEVTIEHREPLVGEDLIAWRRADRLSREQKDADLFFEERTRNLLEGTESDSEEEEEEDQLLLDDTRPVAEDQQRTMFRGSAVLLQEGLFDFWLGGDLGVLRTAQKQFPFIDRRRRGDEFGGTMKPEEFVRVEEEAVVVPVVKDGAAREVGGKRKWEEVEVEEEGLPSRVEVKRRVVEVHVRVGYIDLEGLHDGRAVGNLLPRLNARKMVIVNSSPADVDAFYEMWKDIPRVTRDVYAPVANDTIDISVDTHQYEIRLSDEIAKNIKWQTVENQQIAHIVGSFTTSEPAELNGTPLPDSSALVKPLPTLSLLSRETDGIPAARPLHVGQVRLLELKQRLQKAGYDAVLGEGVLVCDGVVRVLKEEGGSGVRIEGVITGDSARKAFWDVRKAVYEGLAVV